MSSDLAPLAKWASVLAVLATDGGVIHLDESRRLGHLPKGRSNLFPAKSHDGAQI